MSKYATWGLILVAFLAGGTLLPLARAGDEPPPCIPAGEWRHESGVVMRLDLVTPGDITPPLTFTPSPSQPPTMPASLTPEPTPTQEITAYTASMGPSFAPRAPVEAPPSELPRYTAPEVTPDA